MKKAEKPPELKNISKKALLYILGLKEELKKVSWISQKELFVSVKLVIATLLICGIGLYVCDLFVKLSLESLGAVFRGLFF